jgi:hypothetical protein
MREVAGAITNQYREFLEKICDADDRVPTPLSPELYVPVRTGTAAVANLIDACSGEANPE